MNASEHASTYRVSVQGLPGMTLVRDAQQLRPQDTVHLTLGRGHATATIDSIEDTKNG